jgi:hypothetical protein
MRAIEGVPNTFSMTASSSGSCFKSFHVVCPRISRADGRSCPAATELLRRASAEPTVLQRAGPIRTVGTLTRGNFSAARAGYSLNHSSATNPCSRSAIAGHHRTSAFSRPKMNRGLERVVNLADLG